MRGDEHRRELERRVAQGDQAARAALVREGCRTRGHHVEHMLDVHTALHLVVNLKRIGRDGFERLRVTCPGCRALITVVDPRKPTPETAELLMAAIRCVEDHARSEGVTIAPLGQRCRKACPHGDRCRLPLDHEEDYLTPGIRIGCSHVWCDCNEPNLTLPPDPELPHTGLLGTPPDAQGGRP